MEDQEANRIDVSHQPENISHLRGTQQFSLFENLHTTANVFHPGRVAVIDGLELLSAIPSFIQTRVNSLSVF